MENKLKEISMSELIDLIWNNRKIIIKFNEKQEHAESIYYKGRIHVGTYLKYRETNNNDGDCYEGLNEIDSLIAKKIVLYDDNLEINENNIINIECYNNFIFCATNYSLDKYPNLNKNDIKESLHHLMDNQGKYITVFYDINELIFCLENKINKGIKLIESRNVIYKDGDIKLFQKRTKYMLEYEYRFVFNIHSNDISELNLKCDLNKCKMDIFKLVK